jgi:hypothetical protein
VKITIEICCDDDAFGEARTEKLEEAARILREAAARLGHGAPARKLYDRNGNACGVVRCEG